MITVETKVSWLRPDECARLKEGLRRRVRKSHQKEATGAADADLMQIEWGERGVYMAVKLRGSHGGPIERPRIVRAWCMTLATFFLAFLALPSADAKAATQPTIKEWPTNLRTDLKGTSLKLVLPENAVDKPWDDALIAKFGELTGITVQVVRPGNDMTAVLAGYLQGFTNGSADGDVYAIDIVWPAIFSGYAEDLRTAAIGTQEMLPTLIQNDTIKGKLVAIPYFTEVSLLFYRRDLLSKYHFPLPPVTWNELEQQARAIQNGERSQGTNSFWGFLWQGAPSEALTCNALEWQISQGGGPLINPDGTLGIQQDQFVGALQRARGWINTISPADVTSQLEDDSLRQWKQGEAAFMRNWPYAYPESMSPGSLVRNQVGVTVLPKGNGPGGRHSDVLGGFQLMVSKTSKNKNAAIELIKFLTSPEIQRVNAVTRGYLPTRRALYDDPAVLQAHPFIGSMKHVLLEGAVTRPSTAAGQHYDDVSKRYFTAVRQILMGQKEAAAGVQELKQEIQRILIK